MENRYPSTPMIGSHSVIKRKLNGRTKARILELGHLYKDKDVILGDAPSVNIERFRTVLSISVENKWHNGLMDMITAYIQDLCFDPKIYIRHLWEENAPGILCKRNAAAYGLTDSRTFSYLTSNGDLLSKHGLIRLRC